MRTQAYAGNLRASAAAPAGRRLLAMVVIVAAALAPCGKTLAATYKWVDEKGVVHYTDKLPPEQVNKSSTVLDKQARPVKQIEPPLTGEQRAAREAEEERRKAAAKAAEESARKDRALLQSFSSAGEIELSKSRALATIDNQIASATAYMAQLTKRKADAEARRKALGDKPMPSELERELSTVDGEMRKQEELVAAKKREIAQVSARYDADYIRWRELKAISDAAAAANAERQKAADADTAPPGARPATAKK
jgi:hypothetical protein